MASFLFARERREKTAEGRLGIQYAQSPVPPSTRKMCEGSMNMNRERRKRQGWALLRSVACAAVHWKMYEGSMHMKQGPIHIKSMGIDGFGPSAPYGRASLRSPCEFHMDRRQHVIAAHNTRLYVRNYMHVSEVL